ncbi:MAG: DNA ligase D [Candidatus Fluviicola riflensis]|nr:MAG: DNA ligase D [Candidatus Fluviicola riflensis]OGS75849.1 MAG: DNA ligase D [Candidatus Fluviicola riflensis]OGS83529.1 MAG: DNA ligase D [Fluviicola sp. RIFCSPHIGHO2_01_FULL_43_53]OGS85668.1 MAG: DNA ligase D [Fluviicola sp. RIFCSPHIGHO2_12_FULL_43_24]
MALKLYRKKRNFKQTPEPSTGKEKPSVALTFVVQRHDASHLHYDFRLEMEGVLKSWAVPKGPSMKAGERRLAVHVEDHPLAYGKFYGEIPKGNYGAGIVEIWDNGTYTPIQPEKGTSAEKQLLRQYAKGDLKFVLKGKHLNGAFALVRMNDGTDKNWLLIKKSDEHAVKSYTISEIDPVKAHKKKEPDPENEIQPVIPTQEPEEPVEQEDTKTDINHAWSHLKKPMLATLAKTHNDHPDWLYEPKYDGYRAITKISNGKVEMVSRNGNSFNKAYETLLPELERFEDDLILDGEIVIENRKGISNFQLLQNYTTTRKGILRYYVFDLLYLNGHSITQLPFIQRRELLEAVFTKVKLEHIQPSPIVKEKGEELMKRLTKMGYEGVIAKESSSRYFPGARSDAWLKLKNRQSLEAIICGYTAPQNSRKFFGSLILGICNNEKLVYIGNCGSGFTDTSLKELHVQFEKLKTAKSPFDPVPKMTGQKGKPTWIKPQLVCNIEFANWTEDKHLRVPVFMGLRTDKKASETMKNNDTQPDIKTGKSLKDGRKTASEAKKTEDSDQEIRISGKKLKVTNRNKVYFPESDITKGDLIDYYRKISPFILPYLKKRPQSLNRHPNGITKPGFYQKDMDTEQIPEWVHTEKQYSKSNDEYLDYLICDNEATLVYMVNLGCIEINPWHSLYDRPDYPDYMIMDLDPGNIGFKEVVQTALKIREVCTEIGIETFCKTSGATGLHVYIPLKKRYTYDEIKLFGELLATAVQHQLPETTSIERTVSKRVDKIYIDFLQNRKGQTIAAAYSARPKPGATVSTPLEWDEVNDQLDPKDFTIFTIHERLKKKGDLWKGVLGKGADIGKALAKLETLLGEEE